MMGLILTIVICYGLYRMVKAVPSAIRFGLENQDAFRGGAGLFRRMFK